MARLGTNARALFESHYTEEKMLNAYKHLYFELLEKNCPGAAVATEHRSNLPRAASQEAAHDGSRLVSPRPSPKGGTA